METNQLSNITLIHGDCMEYLRSLPDKAFSIAVCDPPYGSASSDSVENEGGYKRFVGGGWFNRYKVQPIRGQEGPILTSRISPQEAERKSINKVEIEWDIAPTAEYFEQLFRVSENQIIWGANYFPNMPPTRCFLVWRKLSISDKFTMAMAEYAWTSFFANAKVFECAPQGKANDPRFHPTAKPIELYKWIYSNFAKEGDTILDTHLGSGSSAIAAHQLGFKFTGIEINDYYYQKAKERLERYQSQLTLEL